MLPLTLHNGLLVLKSVKIHVEKLHSVLSLVRMPGPPEEIVTQHLGQNPWNPKTVPGFHPPTAVEIQELIKENVLALASVLSTSDLKKVLLWGFYLYCFPSSCLLSFLS